MTNFCVFTGSSLGKREVYREKAHELGATLANRGIGVVYGGATVGLMGAVADGALSQGGKVYGVIPEALADYEIAHQDLTELFVVSSMHERKAKMADLSDGFIAMPGGIGTLEETFEVWTWSQLGFHSKPLGLLNVDGFYARLEDFLDQLVEEEFVKPAHRGMVCTNDDPVQLIDQLLDQDVPAVRKWIDRNER